MSPETNDITLTIRADDQVTPVLRRLRREVWFFQNADRLIGALVGVVIFGAGLLLGGALR